MARSGTALPELERGTLETIAVGVRYETEIARLPTTWSWAGRADVAPLIAALDELGDRPLFAVGSGGSLVAADFAAALHRARGYFAQAVTPLELAGFKPLLPRSGVLLISSSGRNPDVIYAANVSAQADVRELLVLTANPRSPLTKIAEAYWRSTTVAIQFPFPKDGFLATNSLLALCRLLSRAFGFDFSADDLPQISVPSSDVIASDTLWVLYSSWGRPAALDLESKCSEAALSHVLLADLRNFAHGRHNWLDKRGDTTALLFLTDQESQPIAERTAALIPEGVPFDFLTSATSGPRAALELITGAMSTVGAIGKARQMDPGRPGIPDWGRKLYHMRVATEPPLWETQCIRRKAGIVHDPSQRQWWRDALEDFRRRLESSRVGGVVLDYDGTLCSREGRFERLSNEVTQELERLLSAGIVIGVATGRGRSARSALQAVLPSELWDQVLVGYYNGGQIASLSDDQAPLREGDIDASILGVYASIEADPVLSGKVETNVRPHQVTIEHSRLNSGAVLDRLQFVVAREAAHLRMLQSSHSSDIIPHWVSKTEVVHRVEARIGEEFDILCIGDSGRWPGNDYELLAAPLALSVDQTSSDPQTCWNLSRIGEGGVQSLVTYLRALMPCDDGGGARFDGGALP